MPGSEELIEEIKDRLIIARALEDTDGIVRSLRELILNIVIMLRTLKVRSKVTHWLLTVLSCFLQHAAHRHDPASISPKH